MSTRPRLKVRVLNTVSIVTWFAWSLLGAAWVQQHATQHGVNTGSACSQACNGMVKHSVGAATCNTVLCSDIIILFTMYIYIYIYIYIAWVQQHATQQAIDDAEADEDSDLSSIDSMDDEEDDQAAGLEL